MSNDVDRIAVANMEERLKVVEERSRGMENTIRAMEERNQFLEEKFRLTENKYGVMEKNVGIVEKVVEEKFGVVEGKYQVLEEKLRMVDVRCGNLEENDRVMNKRVFLLEAYIEDKFREPFREFVNRRSTFYDSGGGDGFHNDFNQRGNRRHDSFEEYEDAFNSFDPRGNGIRRRSINTRSSSSNASYRNVASVSNKRSKASTSGLRKRARLSVSNATYQRRLPSIEYGTPIVTPTVGVEETGTSSRHTILQIFNNETSEQHQHNGTENGISAPEIVLDTTPPENTTEQLRSEGRIEIDSVFKTLHQSENLSDKSSSGPKESAATTAFAAVDMTHVTVAKEILTATAVPFKTFKKETEGKQVFLKASSSAATKNYCNTPTNDKDVSLQSEKDVPVAPPLTISSVNVNTNDAETTGGPVVIDLTINVPSATPLKSPQQLPLPTLGPSVVTPLNTKLSNSAFTVDTESPESNNNAPFPPSSEIDMIAATNNSIPVGCLTETESLATGAHSFTQPLESLSMNNNRSLSDTVIPADATNTTISSSASNAAAVSLENSLNDVINPPISITRNPTPELNCSPVDALQSEESMDDEASSEDSHSIADGSTSSDSDGLEVRNNSIRRNMKEGEIKKRKISNAESTRIDNRPSMELPRTSLKRGPSTEADVITLSSDSESNDNVSAPSKSSNNVSIVVVEEKQSQHNAAGSAEVLKRLIREYPDTRTLTKKVSALRQYDILGAKCSPGILSASRGDISVNGSLPVSVIRQLPSTTRSSKPVKPSYRFLMHIDNSGSSPKRRLSNRTVGQPQAHSSRSISSISNSRTDTEPSATEKELEDYDADLIEIVNETNESSSFEDVMAGKSSRVSGKVAARVSQIETVHPSVSSRGENERTNIETKSLQDQDAIANVERNSNAKVWNTDRENQSKQKSISVAAESRSPSDTDMYSCHQVRNETSIVISRKPPSSKPSLSISAAAAITIDESESYGQRNPSATIHMDSLDLPERDVGAISPERLPPPLIRIDNEDRSEVRELEEESRDNESSKDIVDDDPTMPVLSVSGSQTSPSSETTSVQDKTRSDKSGAQLQQSHLSDSGANTSNGESQDSETVNGQETSGFNLNHYMVDSAFPFIDDGSDRRCKRKTFRCKCDSSFLTQKELEQHIVDEHYDDQIDSEYDSQVQEQDPSYKGRIKHQQSRSARSKNSSLSNVSGAVVDDSESESEQLSVRKSRNVNGRHSVQEQSVICPYCKHKLLRNHRRQHIRSTQCTISEEQLNVELRSRRKLDWEPASENPGYVTWKVPVRKSTSGSKVNKNENDDVISKDVSNDMTGQENSTLDNESNQSVSANAKVVHAGPSTDRLAIAERDISSISSKTARKEDGVTGRFSANHYEGSKLRKIRIGHNGRISKVAEDSSNSFDSDNSHPTKRARSLPDESFGRMVAVHRGSQSTVSEFDRDRVGDIFSPSPGVSDDINELEVEPRGGEIMETDERVNFPINFEGGSNVLLNESAVTELVSESEDRSSATEESLDDEEPSKPKSGGDAADRETVICPACGKFLQQRNLQRHSTNGCPARRSPKKKQPALDDSKLVCKYEDCAYISANYAEYQGHLDLHPPYLGIACNARGCGKVFIDKLNLAEHNKTHRINVPHDATRVSIVKSRRLQPVVSIKRLDACSRRSLQIPT